MSMKISTSGSTTPLATRDRTRFTRAAALHGSTPAPNINNVRQ
jgi:hypothetical protein